MKDYSDIGLDNKLRAKTSISNRPTEYRTALEDNIKQEPTPYLHRTALSQRGGTVQTNLGGIFQIRDTTGGTVLLTANPDTGVVTISGSLITQAGIDIGTLNNSLISGTTRTTGTVTGSAIYSGGTFNNIVIGTQDALGGTLRSATLGGTAGTINNAIFGTQDSTGGTIRTAVLNNSTIGTPASTGGTINSVVIGTQDALGGTLRSATLGGTAGTINNTIMGTPDITGGTHDSAIFGTPTLQTPTIDGTANLDINTGSPALSINGDFAIETHTGSAILVARVGGTSFYFTSAGTLA